MNNDTINQVLGGLTGFLSQMETIAARKRQQELQGLQFLASQPQFTVSTAPGAERAGFVSRMFGRDFKGENGRPVVSIGGSPVTVTDTPTIGSKFPSLGTGDTLPPDVSGFLTSQFATANNVNGALRLLAGFGQQDRGFQQRRTLQGDQFDQQDDVIERRGTQALEQIGARAEVQSGLVDQRGNQALEQIGARGDIQRELQSEQLQSNERVAGQRLTATSQAKAQNQHQKLIEVVGTAFRKGGQNVPLAPNRSSINDMTVKELNDALANAPAPLRRGSSGSSAQDAEGKIRAKIAAEHRNILRLVDNNEPAALKLIENKGNFSPETLQALGGESEAEKAARLQALEASRTLIAHYEKQLQALNPGASAASAGAAQTPAGGNTTPVPQAPLIDPGSQTPSPAPKLRILRRVN